MEDLTATLTLLTGLAGILIVSLFAIAVLSAIYKKKIKLDHLLSEKNGHASLSRFQFLVFTFVIGFALIYVTLESKALPEVGTSVMVLLGISGGTYVVSKGIQGAHEEAAKAEGKQGEEEKPADPPAPPG